MHPDGTSGKTVEARPIEAAEFDAAMAPLLGAVDGCLTVACSGGPDSIALVVLAAEWAGRHGIPVQAVTVDHGLRPEAPAEAKSVAESLNAHGIPAVALHHEGAIPKSDVQAAAREIRYRLLADWLSVRTGKAVLLAHHQDDQAETLLLRLGRGSGVDGLSAMAPVTHRDGLILLRPLLGFPKARLEATAVRSGLPIVRDPSNENGGFARVRVRRLREMLAAEGMTPARLAETASRMARARAALEAARDRFIETQAQSDPTGFLTFAPGPFADLPEEVALRVLSHSVRILGGRAHPPRERYLTALHEAIVSGQLGGGRTLAGTKVSVWRDRILVCREPAGVAAPILLRDGVTWDSRFVCRLAVDPAHEGGGLWEVGALGRQGVTEARKSGPEALNRLPGPVRAAIPAVRRNGRIVSVPHLDLYGDGPLPKGGIAFRAVSDAWGVGFQRVLPFSNPAARPM